MIVTLSCDTHERVDHHLSAGHRFRTQNLKHGPVSGADKTIKLISPDLWPPNSPDLNPVDHTICAFYGIAL